MKRFAAGAVAVATALSLSTGVASAEDGLKDLFAGVGDAIDIGANTAVNGKSDLNVGSTETSSDIIKDWDAKDRQGSAESHKDFYMSSMKNDAKNGYATGTTADILWGVGIAAAVLAAGAAAVNAGVIPAFPFRSNSR